MGTACICTTFCARLLIQSDFVLWHQSCSANTQNPAKEGSEGKSCWTSLNQSGRWWMICKCVYPLWRHIMQDTLKLDWKKRHKACFHPPTPPLLAFSFIYFAHLEKYKVCVPLDHPFMDELADPTLLRYIHMKEENPMYGNIMPFAFYATVCGTITIPSWIHLLCFDIARHKFSHILTCQSNCLCNLQLRLLLINIGPWAISLAVTDCKTVATPLHLWLVSIITGPKQAK